MVATAPLRTTRVTDEALIGDIVDALLPLTFLHVITTEEVAALPPMTVIQMRSPAGPASTCSGRSTIG